MVPQQRTKHLGFTVSSEYLGSVTSYKTCWCTIKNVRKNAKRGCILCEAKCSYCLIDGDERNVFVFVVREVTSYSFWGTAEESSSYLNDFLPKCYAGTIAHTDAYVDRERCPYIDFHLQRCETWCIPSNEKRHRINAQVRHRVI
jgi:hypothetical protein